MSNRVAIGDIGGGTFGFRISAPGADALTTGIDNRFFDGQYETVQVFAEGSVSVANGSIATIAISPAFSYVPFILVQCKRSTGVAAGVYARYNASAGSWQDGFLIYGQPHQILIENHRGSTALFGYTIFKNKAAA